LLESEMKKLPLTMACGPYDRMEALAQGVIQPEGIDLRYLAIQSPPEIFARMIKTRSFDVAEMSLAHYCIMRMRGEFPFVAIPVFPSRVFRHGFIFVNKSAGINTAKDLEGKRIGVQEYRQTAGVWVRGILQHDYGVDLDTIHWLEGGVNEPRVADHEMDLRPVRPLSLELIPSHRTLNDMLESGEIDAYFGARRPAAFDKGKNVARLFPDYRKREKDFYQRTGFHPIMHTLVIREDLYREQPWAAESLFKACQESKAWALKQVRFSGAQRLMLPWLFDEIAEMDELMGADPWPYGLEPNRKILEAFVQYLVDQHFVETAQPIEELFAPIIAWSE
jgi:4,5-dihydroxyphthalate decarboxylase